MRLSLVALLLLTAAANTVLSQDTSRGVQLFDSHDRAGAKTEFSAALKRNDRDARAHYYLGRLAMLENDADAAAEHFERAVKLDASVADYHFWYGSAVAQQATRASKLRQPILAKRMKAAVERAVALDGNNIDARDLLRDFYSMAPGIMGGSEEKAREQAAAIARVDATRGYLAAARLAMQRKDTAGVEREMDAAIAAAPDSLRAYSALATWYATAKRWPQAFATVERYAARRPADPYGSYHLGRIAALSGQHLARGEESLRSFLANPPRDAAPVLLSRAHMRLGQILNHQGRRTEARSALEQALTIDPRNDDAKKALQGIAR
jgi:tetratricopeptide (TPR) repeat protein